MGDENDGGGGSCGKGGKSGEGGEKGGDGSEGGGDMSHSTVTSPSVCSVGSSEKSAAVYTKLVPNGQDGIPAPKSKRNWDEYPNELLVVCLMW